MNLLNVLILLCTIGPLFAGGPLDYKFVKVPPGKFTIYIPTSSTTGLEYIKKDVEFKKGFSIGKYEVTNAQWNQCYKEKFCSKKARVKKGEKGNHPVVRLNWHQARAFSIWFSKKLKKTVRLPTEEEWAYSMNRGKDYREEVYNYNYKSFDAVKNPPKITLPIGSINKNEWGIYDYEGNVWEWTLSCWYASEENILKKRTPESLNNSRACTTRVVQGENRSHIPDIIADTYNGGCATLRPAANLGFRLLMEH